MAPSKVAPYGDWESRISVEAATAGSKSLKSPRVCPTTGRVFFAESRSDGTNAIVEVTEAGPSHVLPSDFSASTIVYEYGGSAYAVVQGDEARIVFSDAGRNSVNLLAVDGGTVEEVLASSSLRYADFDSQPLAATRDGGGLWILAVEEDHARPEPANVRNYVVVINLETKTVKRLASGADFYSNPRFSPDGRQVAWLQWDHPNLPWRGVQLYSAAFNATEGSVTDVKLIAGDDGDSIAEPSWGPDGTLYFGSDKSGFRQLCRYSEGAVERLSVVGLENAELGNASFLIGCQTYVFLTDISVVAAVTRFGTSQLVHINLESQKCTQLEVPLVDIRDDCIGRLSATSVILIGSGHTSPKGVYRVDILPGLATKVTLISSSVDENLPESLFSTPESIQFTTLAKPEREVYGFFWPPHNPGFEAPEGTLPPLIVVPHGGPTSYTAPGLKMGTQYYTSRGYAYFAINYTGSSGHGKAYVEALNGEWGVLDRDDVVEAISYLAQRRLIDKSRVGIEGRSAGGYNVLCALTGYPHAFAGGISHCGVSDIKALDAETHKMESRYVEGLLKFEGKTEGEKEALYRERSPLYHAEDITAPLLLVHGDADSVVPIEQSKEIKRRIESRGGGVKLVVLEGEGHIYKRAESLRIALVEAEKWWRKTLLKKD
ncbi:Dipeptidyl aminopeptidase BIII [Madurella mycetomatis]|uniref:Dipeptidyl aminopeptidase BIII n=1 Tax=Madurella mycetomatis TaxID=100816 RepID=A0A175VXG7_9PEZI|nr:Dipeptidyl aminopeptidase BIII [Madurella mycetomatis]